MAPQLKLTAVALGCADVDRMRAFYTGTLGLPVRRELPDWLELETGAGAPLALKPGGSADGPGASSVHHLAFLVERPEDVDAWHAQLVAADVAIDQGPTDQVWNERTCFLRDPEGNLVEICALL